ncbi:MAG: ABC transporter ATP-binding protein [Gemmiger sp.]|uniref:ABC transporter ATP-binding protein n=1 Tax=Gemmiger sp. TaxID=2049027 RepID=UPI002E77821C|nr:ABC transporter ATP-binding protein [Gemmiger sp.]MEE0799923.1 ABC transporter ATP-binding protein [Gemmiger sp.]
MKEKPRYNTLQNVGFMMRAAWHTDRSVPLLCVAVAAVTAGQTVTELLLAPAVLARVESHAALASLVERIVLFGAVLFVLYGLRAYLQENVLYGRVAIRTELMTRVSSKMAQTSFPNLLDTAFLRQAERSNELCSDNSSPTEAIWKTLTELLTSLIGFAVYLALLSGLHPLLLTVVLVTTVLGYLFSHRVNVWIYSHRDEEEEYRSRLAYLNRVCTDRSYAKDLRIFGLKPWLNEVWDRVMRLFEAYLKKQQLHYLAIDVADLVLTFARDGIAYAYLIGLALTRGMPASQFLLYFTAVSGFTQWVTGILDKGTELHRQSLDLSLLRGMLEWPEPFRLTDGEPLPCTPAMPCELRFDHVSYRYPEAERDTLHDIDLTIRAGEKLAVVGLNGAGKTTLVRLACGFLDPTQGRVLLNGRDIRDFNRRDYYALFSAVFQDFSLLEASIAQNVAQRQEGIDTAAVWSCLDKAGLTGTVRALPQGLDTKLGRRVYEDGVELSGGQIQRLMLARALYKNGPILVLDEPTAALDPLAEDDIYQKYNRMTAGRTAIFISHRLASTRFCDRILFLEQGRITEQGTHESLLAAGGGYAALFAVQSQYYREGGTHDEPEA